MQLFGNKRRPKTEARASGKWFLYIFCGLFATVGFITFCLGGVMLFTEGSFSESTAALLIVGAVFMLFGVGMIFGSRSSGSANVSKSTIPDWQLSQSRGGIEELKPKMGGAKGLFFITVIFALIWNGVVWLMINSEEEVGWFLWLFAGIGVLTIIATVWRGLALLNPKLKITLHDIPITPGKRFAVSWVVDGKIDRLDDVCITLIGQEQATYQRGTDTYTDTHDFFTLSEDIAPEHLHMGRGELRFELPENTMHTWHSSSNGIVWLLQVRGGIPKWPDIKDDYEITVYATHSV